MTTATLAIEIKKNVSIVDLLTKLGYAPAKTSGKETIYLSMLRDSDTKPSLCVNNELGVWYDHGGPNWSGCRGGNIIDFGIAYWRTKDVTLVIERIVTTTNYQLVCISNEPPIPKSSRPRIPIKLPNYKVEDVREIGNTPAITEYLKSRGIYDLAKGRLKEISYYVKDESGKKKHFFAAGWKNNMGGWEVRNKYFKGCIGHKGITVISGSGELVVMFEGYLNYLSWLIDNPDTDHTLINLNTITLLDIGIKIAKDFSRVDIFFDNDPAGEAAQVEVIKAIPYAVDRSNLYTGFNDYNEMITSRIKTQSDASKPVNLFANLKVSFSR